MADSTNGTGLQSAGVVFGIRTPPATRYRSGWVAGRRIADPSTTFGPYIDVLSDQDFALQKDPRAYEKMKRDPTIRSAIRLRQLATASRQIEFLPRVDSPAGKEAAAFATAAWARVRRPTEVLVNILDAIPEGSSFQECVWKPDVETLTWYTEEILPVHKNRFIFNLEGLLCLKTPHDIFYGQTVPPRVFIHHRYDPEPADFENPDTEGRLYFGAGEYDRLYPYYLYKYLILRLGFVYTDRLAFPIKIGRYPYRDETARAETEAFLKLLDHHRVAMWPSGEGWDVDFLQTSATGHNVAMDWINYLDTSMQRMILGSTMMQDSGEKGAYALGTSQIQNVFGSIIEFDSNSLCDTLENTWTRWLFEMNGRPTSLAPKVRQVAAKNIDPGQIVDWMLMLADRGYPVTIEQVAEVTGVRPAKPGETLLVMSGPGLGNVDLIHGAGSPFTGASEAADIPGIAESMEGKRSQLGFSGPDQHVLDFDIPVEKSIKVKDLETGKVTLSRGLYRKATKKDIQRKVGVTLSTKIQRYAKQNRKIIFEYTNLKGETKRYRVEPYSYRYRRGKVYLYAFDPKDFTIKSFFAHKLKNVRGGGLFKPRWVVEIAA